MLHVNYLMCNIQYQSVLKLCFKQKLMVINTKPSQRLGAASPDPRIWNLLLEPLLKIFSLCP